MPQITDAELEALHSRLATLERQKASQPKLCYADWSEAIRRAQTKKFMERQARAQAGAEAREAALRGCKKEKDSLESRLGKVAADRASRLEQHDRAGAKIREEFAEHELATRAALRELQDRVDAEVQAAEASPVNVVVPQLPPVEIDDSDMRRCMERPMRDRNGKMVNPVTGLRFGGLR